LALAGAGAPAALVFLLARLRGAGRVVGNCFAGLGALFLFFLFGFVCGDQDIYYFLVI
jgi:hypothetical protein